MKICVVGAGVIGLTTAYALARRGHDVTLVDAQGKTGQGASLANGGQLSYSYVAPLADPSVWKNLPAYLLDSDSPLSWKPALDLDQSRWIARFLMACNGKASRRATAELLRLAFFSRDCLASLQDELKLDFGLRSAGKLVMLSSAAALAAARRQVEFQRRLGCAQEVLSAERCIEIEPALGAGARAWAGGVYTASEQVGDCAAFCEQLTGALQRQHPALQLRLQTTVSGAIVESRRVAALRSKQGDIEADAFVLANGAASASLAAAMGFTLPIYPLKGYSVTFDSDEGSGLPSVSVTDASKKIVYARIGTRLRVAGRVEIVGHDSTLDERRWRALAGEARRLFPALATARDDLFPWAGLRPATPTGVPIIGRGPLENVFINAGHGALGWTLACGSAEMLAADIEGKPAAAGLPSFAFH